MAVTRRFKGTRLDGAPARVKDSNFIKKRTEERSNLSPQKPLAAISSHALESEFAVLNQRASPALKWLKMRLTELKHWSLTQTSDIIVDWQVGRGPHYGVYVVKENHPQDKKHSDQLPMLSVMHE